MEGQKCKEVTYHCKHLCEAS